MARTENPVIGFASPVDEKRLDGLALRWSKISAFLCGVLILGTILTTVSCYQDGGMGAGMFFIVFLPLASVPVGLYCLAGLILSAVAVRRYHSPASREALWISVVAPLAVLAIYGGCFAMMLADRV